MRAKIKTFCIYCIGIAALLFVINFEFKRDELFYAWIVLLALGLGVGLTILSRGKLFFLLGCCYYLYRVFTTGGFVEAIDTTTVVVVIVSFGISQVARYLLDKHLPYKSDTDKLIESLHREHGKIDE